MENTRKIITENIDLFPEFQYYVDVVVVKIEENEVMNPDISVESCKSLIEWLCKAMLKRIEGLKHSEARINALELSPLMKETMEKLAEYSGRSIEDNFIKRIVSLVFYLWEIRNARWDISHGRHSPKLELSTPEFAKMTKQITDGLVGYILSIFYWDGEIKEMQYEDNADFNSILDDENPIEGISYSLALFEQDMPKYIELYDKFVENNAPNM
jgi:hypothetical protein